MSDEQPEPDPAPEPEPAAEPAPPPEPETAIEHRPADDAPKLIDADALGSPTTAVGSAAMGLSVIPPEMEMRAIAQLANTLAMAELCPKALRRKPNDVFLVLLTARDLGTAITTALREFHPIDGRVTLSPKVKLAMVRSRPDLGRIRPAPDNSATSATWHSWRADGGGECVSSTFTWEDAQLAHLVDSRCTAYAHWKPERSSGTQSSDCLCKSNWKTYPKRMLSWRALGYLLDDEYPEVGTGLYSPDEMGAVTNEEGEPIDVTAVEALPGMKRPQGQSAPGGAVDDDPQADPETIAELVRHLDATRQHPEARAELQAWWQEKEIGPLAQLPARRAGMVRARFAGLERAHDYTVSDDDPVEQGADSPAEAPGGAESPIPASGPDPTRCEDGNVAGWLVDLAKAKTKAEIVAEYRAAGLKVPDGNADTLRGMWARERFDVICAGLLAAFGVPAVAE